MKKMKLIILSLAGLAFSRPAGLCTANSVADEVEALKKQFGELQEQNAALQKQLDDAKSAASKTIIGDELNLGPFRLPEGIDKKDVLWRVRAGLDVKQAVEAAVAQKKHDDAVKSAKK